MRRELVELTLAKELSSIKKYFQCSWTRKYYKSTGKNLSNLSLLQQQTEF